MRAQIIRRHQFEIISRMSWCLTCLCVCVSKNISNINSMKLVRQKRVRLRNSMSHIFITTLSGWIQSALMLTGPFLIVCIPWTVQHDTDFCSAYTTMHITLCGDDFKWQEEVPSSVEFDWGIVWWATKHLQVLNPSGITKFHINT